MPILGFLLPILGNWQRILIYAALAALVVTVIWGHGYHKGSQRLFEYQAEQARAAVAIVQKQGKVTTSVVTRYIERAAATETVVKEIEKEVTRYAEQNPDGLCIDRDWIRLHDRAADGLSDPARPAPGGLRAPGTAPGLRYPYRVPGTPDGDRELRAAPPLRRHAG